MKKLFAKGLAAIYGAAVWFWHATFRWFPDRVKKVDARVISIGNITWGGTGKTPLAVKIARELTGEGKKVAVLTRGYGDDEVKELQKKLPGIPIIVNKNRVRAAREAVQKHGAQVLLMDDGFQHRSLHRDLDMVMLNATEPFGPGGLIPLGSLREPLDSLARADVFVLTKCDVGLKNVHWIRQKINAIKPNALIFESIHKPVVFRDPLRNRTIQPYDLKGRKVAALSGIGDPYSFEKTVELLGAEIQFAARYEDHHLFKNSEITAFVKQARAMGLKEAVTTEKDYFRLQTILEKTPSEDARAFTFWVLEIEFQVNDEEDFIRRCMHS
jgi:tetraacyldisaccharide 4'-kinase